MLNQIAGALLRGDEIPAATTYLALSTTVPNPDGTAWTEMPQSGYGGYGRVALAGLLSNPVLGAQQNSGQVEFPLPTSGGAVMAAWGLWTAPTGGTFRGFVALQPAPLVVAGVRPRFQVATLIGQAVSP
jgi:hypothetical protein